MTLNIVKCLLGAVCWPEAHAQRSHTTTSNTTLPELPPHNQPILPMKPKDYEATKEVLHILKLPNKEHIQKDFHIQEFVNKVTRKMDNKADPTTPC